MGTLASELQAFAAGRASAPRVYVDANVPRGTVVFMRQMLGWDVLFVLEDDALRRAADRDHFAKAYELGRTLITLDRDFIDEVRFPVALSPGVIVCFAPDERALMRILQFVDRTLLRPAGTSPLPLRGQTIELTPDLVT